MLIFAQNLRTIPGSVDEQKSQIFNLTNICCCIMQCATAK